MSTNSECEFIEVQPGIWYYVLEDMMAPKNAFDWREFAQAYGPFYTFEQADQHLRRNHANPGGHTVTEHDTFHRDEVFDRLIYHAQR